MIEESGTIKVAMGIIIGQKLTKWNLEYSFKNEYQTTLLRFFLDSFPWSIKKQGSDIRDILV